MPSRSSRPKPAKKIPRSRDLARLLLKFETDETCRADNEKVSKALQKHSKEGRRVANRLLTCVRERDDFCSSAACRRCLRRFRRHFYASASRIAELFVSNLDLKSKVGK